MEAFSRPYNLFGAIAHGEGNYDLEAGVSQPFFNHAYDLTGQSWPAIDMTSETQKFMAYAQAPMSQLPMECSRFPLNMAMTGL